jgi:hypothetical protein
MRTYDDPQKPRPHPMQFDDEQTPIRSVPYSPFMRWCAMWILVPSLYIACGFVAIVQSIWGKLTGKFYG